MKYSERGEVQVRFVVYDPDLNPTQLRSTALLHRHQPQLFSGRRWQSADKPQDFLHAGARGSFGETRELAVQRDEVLAALEHQPILSRLDRPESTLARRQFEHHHLEQKFDAGGQGAETIAQL